MYKISRKDYAQMYGPTVGDRVRLADTSLIVEVEKDYCVYGDEATVPKYEVMLDRCKDCKSKKIVVYDELLEETNGDVIENHRFDEVAKLEAQTADERFAFWRNELSRCIRCNACRNVCPACTC